MAKKSNKAVVSSNVETKVEEQVETKVEEQVTQPSMLASMLQQEVKPLEEAQEEKPAEVAVKVEKNQGVGAFVKKLIAEGLTNIAILKIVHEQYGNKQTTYACVAWYRNKMKKAGQVAKTKSALGIVEEMLKNVEAEVQTSAVEE